MFGQFTATHDAKLASGDMSLQSYAAWTLAEVLNAATLLENAEFSANDAAFGQAVFDFALHNLLNVAQEAAVRARRALLVCMSTDGEYLGDGASAEVEGQLEEAGGPLLTGRRRNAENVAAQAVAKRPDLWEKLHSAEDLVLSLGPTLSAPAAEVQQHSGQGLAC